ncbi:MAG: hypothetical protein R3F17_13110 [Planctomycetota bacterium]
MSSAPFGPARPEPVRWNGQRIGGPEIRGASPADEKTLQRLFRGSALPPGLHEPHGPVFAWQGGEPIACLHWVPWAGRMAGESRTWGQFHGGWVHPNWRYGQGGGGLLGQMVRFAQARPGLGAVFRLQRTGGRSRTRQALLCEPHSPLWQLALPVTGWAGGAPLQHIHIQPFRALPWLAEVGAQALRTQPAGVQPGLVELRRAPREGSLLVSLAEQTGWARLAPLAPGRALIADLCVLPGAPAAATLKTLLHGLASAAREREWLQVEAHVSHGHPLFAFALEHGLPVSASPWTLEIGVPGGDPPLPGQVRLIASETMGIAAFE